MKRLGPILCLAAIFSGAAQAGPVPGDYACEVRQKAGIAGIHLEDAGPPLAFIDEALPTRFRLRFAPVPDGISLTVSELPYDGRDRDPREYDTGNTVLHSAYSGDGSDFRSDHDLGLMRFGTRLDGTLWFYHAGFEYPGGVDTALSARWGICERSRS